MISSYIKFFYFLIFYYLNNLKFRMFLDQSILSSLRPFTQIIIENPNKYDVFFIFFFIKN